MSSRQVEIDFDKMSNEKSEDNKSISSRLTGDPFVDVGGMALKEYKKTRFQKSIIGVIENIAQRYVRNWNSKINSLFLNSKITQPLFNPDRKIEKTVKLYKGLLHPSKNHPVGFCRTCGKEDYLFEVGRDQFSLSGSGKFVNFNHSHEKGLMLCNECCIKLFFLPLAVIQLGGKLALLHPYSEISRKYWVKKTIKENIYKMGRNTSEGILKSRYKNPKNTLFHFASEIIEEIEDENHSEFLQLFHFTNFGASPDCDIYQLPNPVFIFLNIILRHYNFDWNNFVRRYYLFSKKSKVKWDLKNQTWFKEKKKEKVLLQYDDYLNNRNLVYEKLLSNKSILPQFVKIHRQHYYNKLENFSKMIAIYYVKEVLNMKDQQIQLIRRISDVVFDLSQKENNFKKYLVMLEGSGRAFQLRSALLKIIKANFRNGAKEPLIRLEEYVNYLFPDGQYWDEVRDLLLIHLYEKFHDEGVNVEETSEESIVDIEEKSINEI